MGQSTLALRRAAFIIAAVSTGRAKAHHCVDRNNAADRHVVDSGTRTVRLPDGFAALDTRAARKGQRATNTGAPEAAGPTACGSGHDAGEDETDDSAVSRTGGDE
jgi:hypothetical protein